MSDLRGHGIGSVTNVSNTTTDLKVPLSGTGWTDATGGGPAQDGDLIFIFVNGTGYAPSGTVWTPAPAPSPATFRTGAVNISIGNNRAYNLWKYVLTSTDISYGFLDLALADTLFPQIYSGVSIVVVLKGNSFTVRETDSSEAALLGGVGGVPVVTSSALASTDSALYFGGGTLPSVCSQRGLLLESGTDITDDAIGAWAESPVPVAPGPYTNGFDASASTPDFIGVVIIIENSNLGVIGVPAVNCAVPAVAIIGVPYSGSCAAVNLSCVNYFTIDSGSLPTGLSMDTAGFITGIPTVLGAFPYTVKCQYGADPNYPSHGPSALPWSVTHSCSMTVVAPLVLNCNNPPDGVVGTPYSHSLIASGGSGSYTNYAIISGMLPTGLSINASTGAITGTPTVDSLFTFTAQVTDSLGETAQVTCSIIIGNYFNFPLTIAKGKLYCVVTGTGRIEVYDFIRQYWRPVLYGLGDCSAIFGTQDGTVIGYFAQDNKLRVLFDETTKLIDGTSPQPIEILNVAIDGASPASSFSGTSFSRNRKDLSTFKSRLFTGGANLNVVLNTDQGSFNLGNISSIALNTEEFLDISQILATCKWFQFDLTGTFSQFLLQDCSVDADIRPQPLTFVRGRNNNFQTGSRKRVRTWPFVIDTRGGIANITPYVDNVAQPTVQFTSPEKTTELYKFLTDVFGIDYGYTILYDGTTEFEFYGDMQPEIVQTLPIAKRFDQVGPQEFFRYGKVQKVSIRIMPWDPENPIASVLQLPYILYFDDETVSTGLIPVLNRQEASYTIGQPKGTSGSILRFEIGPTTFDFHRFNIKILVDQSGKDTDGQWVSIG